MSFKIKKLFSRSEYEKIDINRLKQMQNEGAVIIDVRSPQEFNEYHLEESINIPLYDLAYKIENIITDKSIEIIVYCQYGVRSIKAANLLRRKGYLNIYELHGGLDNIN